MASLAGQASLSRAAPTLVCEGRPILGMLHFFTDRRNFHLDGVAASRSGHFSFYFDKHHIIGVSGLEGRKIFYESKALDMGEGLSRLARPRVSSSLTMAHFKRKAAGKRLHTIFDKILQERKTNGTRRDDLPQRLLDAGDDIAKIISISSSTFF